MWIHLVKCATNDLGVDPITLSALRTITSGGVLLSIGSALLGLNGTINEIRSMPYTLASEILSYTIGETTFSMKQLKL